MNPQLPVILSALAILIGCMTGSATAAQKPNVVIFFTDDQGTLDANCYGSKDLHTPAMDELAETLCKVIRNSEALAYTFNSSAQPASAPVIRLSISFK